MVKEKEKKKKTKHKSVGKIILLAMLVIILFVVAAGTGITLAVIKSSPAMDVNIVDNLKESSKIYDKDGKLISNLANEENRSIVKLNQMPANLQNAFISIEDERFKDHHGIDIKRIFGALWIDLKTRSFAQGGSTITQQLVRNYALTKEKKLTRKIQEMYLSMQLERQLSKDQILEAYLNTIYLGSGSYGVQAASMKYFGKNVEDLDLSECALLASITKNPSKYTPLSKRNQLNPENYLERQRTVLSKMLELGHISQKEYDDNINKKLVFQSKKEITSLKYQWFVEPALDQIAQDLSKKYNIDISEAKQKIRIGGYNIYLTIDPKIQNATQKVIDNAGNYRGIGPRSKVQTYSADDKSKAMLQPQSAAVIFDYTTGQMRAIVGGRGEHPLLSMNRATDVPRQPGSSIKPIAIYGPSIDTKAVSAASVIDDAPMSQEFVSSHGGWNPRNYDRGFSGPTTVRKAITKSINIVAVKLGDKVGTRTSYDYLKNKFHISTLTDDDKYIAPLALGGLNKGVYPYEMAAAYAVFGNGGMYTEPIMYTKVIDRKGNEILNKTPKKSYSLSPQAAYVMADMMQDVVKYGTGGRASLGSMPAAGKTGTTSDNTNVWFCGYTPYLSGAVWVGHDKPNVSLSGLKSSIPAKMWGDIMKEANRGLAVKSFKRPSGLTSVQICTSSGDIASGNCPTTSVTSEVFISGTQPNNSCTVHNSSVPEITIPSDGENNILTPEDPNNPNNNELNPDNNENNELNPDPNNTNNPGNIPTDTPNKDKDKDKDKAPNGKDKDKNKGNGNHNQTIPTETIGN